MTVRLVCVGDSFTEGMCDDLRPDGHHVGWADRVAAALAAQSAGQSAGQVRYANLAVRGKLLDQVLTDQLDLAASLRPTVATFNAGPNDVLRRGTDLPDLFRRYDGAVGRMAAGLAEDEPDGARLLLFTSIGRAGGEGRIGRLLADRFARFNANVREVAARHGALVVDLEPVDALTDRRLWWVDRLHLNAAGHTRVAAAVLEQLGVSDAALLGGEPGWWREPLPPQPRSGRAEQVADDLRWARRHLLPWLARRLRGVSSGDGRRPKDDALRDVPADPRHRGHDPSGSGSTVGG